MSPQPHWRQRAAKHPVTKAILHPAITLVALIILFLLVFFGTLYQTDHGLYEAQRKFFGYGIVLLGGYVPVPASSTVLWVLSIQLAVTMALVLPLQWRKLGLWISHAGIFALLIGGFITQLMAVESQLTLAEGETGHYSTSYHDWELAFWESQGDTHQVVAFTDDMLKPGKKFTVEEFNLEFLVDAYYRNSAAFNNAATGGQPGPINPSGIALIESRPPEKEVERNAPGVIFRLTQKGRKEKSVLLFGMESQPLLLTDQGRTIRCQLRLRHYPLPFALKLTEFTRTVHAGTEIAASYESTADLIEGGQSRPVRIYMNNPLRHAGYTFFQASFSQERNGTERSTFAIVTNPGRLLPYISSLTVFGGLLIHFLVIFVGYARKQSALGSPASAKSASAAALMALAAFGYLATPGLAQGQDMMPMDRPPAELIDTVKADSTHEPQPLSDDLSLLPFGDGKPVKGLKNLDKLSHAAVLHEGRLKPFETFARHHLLQLSGRRTYEKRSAVETMATLLFAPESTVNWKIFQIDNPEVAQGLGIPEEKKRRYSLKQLQKGLHKLQKLAEAANKVEEDKRSLTDKEFLRVWSNVFMLVQLGHSFDFAMPSNPFTLRMPESRYALGLPADRERFSFWELMGRAPALARVLESVGDRPPEERSAVETEIIAVSQAMFLASQSSQPSALKCIPPPPGQGDDWLSPPEAIAKPEHLQRDQAFLEPWIKAMQAYRNGDQAAFDSAMTATQTLAKDRAQAQFAKTSFHLEVPYQKVDPHTKALFLYWIALIGCFLFFLRQNKWLYYGLVTLVSSALFINLAAITARIIIMRRPPVTSLYETFPFVAAVAILTALIIERFNRRGIGLLTASLLGVGLLTVANRYASEGDTMRMLVAVLDSNFWLSTHVITITIGYSACLLCGAIGHVWLVRALLPGKDKVQSLREIQKMIYGTLGFGLIFSFIGTVLGGIWADQSWGRFWGWDPKENGALLIVIWCVILLHARWWGKIRDLGMALGVVFGNIVVSVAWLGVNLLNVGLHSYGFTSGTAYKLMAYILAELLFMLVTGVWIKRKQLQERAAASASA